MFNLYTLRKIEKTFIYTYMFICVPDITHPSWFSGCSLKVFIMFDIIQNLYKKY